MLCRRFESKQSLASMVNVFATNRSTRFWLANELKYQPYNFRAPFYRASISRLPLPSKPCFSIPYGIQAHIPGLSVHPIALREFNFALQILRCRDPPLSRRLLSPPQPRSHTFLLTKMLRRLWAAVHQSMPAFLHPFILPPILIGSTPAHPLLAQVCAYILTIMQKSV